MPEFRKPCDIYQGFNFKKDKQTTVGLITSMTVGTTALTADITTTKDPTNPSASVACVGVVSDALWQLGVTDALYFSGQISIANKQTLNQMLYQDLTNVLVKINFTIYEYDPMAKKYYKCMAPTAELEGQVEKSGSDLNLSVATEPSREVQSPENYAMQIGIKPKTTEQSITIATASGKNIVKAWGVTVT